MTGITDSERIGPLPAGVGDGAAAFYAALHAYAERERIKYTGHEAEMVRQLVLAKDRLDALDAMRAEVDKIAATTDDPEVQLAAVRERLTIMREQRQQAVTLGRQVGQLRLPVGLPEAAGGGKSSGGASLASQHASAAARARWSGRAELRSV
ncbi:hypothetical protein JIG36_32135 [Actinoplanes sp. LDG1-06]|uniref:Uncharacterized protein n=1 Tax=Paractinoplanes ovalisporus TaxID=2810368 RepID=A0ABS2AJZ4_9ACTN|nr:hypothetical protein [Actinoplanes ovalisporus]MBM2620174.1 hypothetical protein [Actinoplanes ovalisporus]